MIHFSDIEYTYFIVFPLNTKLDLQARKQYLFFPKNRLKKCVWWLLGVFYLMFAPVFFLFGKLAFTGAGAVGFEK